MGDIKSLIDIPSLTSNAVILANLSTVGMMFTVKTQVLPWAGWVSWWSLMACKPSRIFCRFTRAAVPKTNLIPSRPLPVLTSSKLRSQNSPFARMTWTTSFIRPIRLCLNHIWTVTTGLPAIRPSFRLAWTCCPAMAAWADRSGTTWPLDLSLFNSSSAKRWAPLRSVRARVNSATSWTRSPASPDFKRARPALVMIRMAAPSISTMTAPKSFSMPKDLQSSSATSTTRPTDLGGARYSPASLNTWLSQAKLSPR